MSLTDEEAAGRPARSRRVSASDDCAHCGSPLRDDQEWCLECGAARTLIHRPPDWRIAAAVIAVVVALALAALRDRPGQPLQQRRPGRGRPAQRQDGRPPPSIRSPPRRRRASAATSAADRVLAGRAERLDRRARQQPEPEHGQRRPRAGSPPLGCSVGVLDSNQHPTHDSRASGSSSPGATQIRAAGQRRRRSPAVARSRRRVARRVAPPGGL